MTEETEAKGRKPDIRLCQSVVDAEGKPSLKGIGGIWKETSKEGKVFYNLAIGGLRLVGFPNDGEYKK